MLISIAKSNPLERVCCALFSLWFHSNFNTAHADFFNSLSDSKVDATQ